MGKNEFEKKHVGFITCGDIFDINGGAWITGYSTTKLKVKDVLLFEGNRYKIKGIQVFKKGEIKKIGDMEECAILFEKINKEEFKALVNSACSRDMEVNTPFKFGEEPTTLYTRFYSK